jgi:hypothetical protein
MYQLIKDLSILTIVYKYIAVSGDLVARLI